MTIGHALRASLLTPLDSEVLLAHCMDQSRTWLLAHADKELTPKQEERWQHMYQRRMAHEPVAYITGEKELYGRPFFVEKGVLIPRPATETLINEVLQPAKAPDRVREADSQIVVVRRIWSDTTWQTIVDVGCGSGCIAITLALEIPDIRCIGIDTSQTATNCTQKNSQRHGVTNRVQVCKGNLLEPVCNLQEPFLLVSNPPYIPEREELMPDVANYEPPEALYAGPKGLDILQELIGQARQHPWCVGFVLECRVEHVPYIDIWVEGSA